MKKQVMFLCTHNSARSQMAEALLRAKAGSSYEAVSAGTNPTELSPLAVSVLREIGIDISQHSVKGVEKYFRFPFDWVITVCDRAREKCPIYPLATWLHWSMEDPITIEDFRRVRDELSRRIDAFLKGEHIQDGLWVAPLAHNKK